MCMYYICEIISTRLWTYPSPYNVHLLPFVTCPSVPYPLSCILLLPGNFLWALNWANIGLTSFISCLRDNPSFYPMPDDLRAIASYILSGRVVSGERVNLVSVISSWMVEEFQPTYLEWFSATWSENSAFSPSIQQVWVVLRLMVLSIHWGREDGYLHSSSHSTNTFEEILCKELSLWHWGCSDD